MIEEMAREGEMRLRANRLTIRQTDKRDGRKVEKYDLFSGRPNAILKRDLYRIVGIIRKSQTS